MLRWPAPVGIAQGISLEMVFCRNVSSRQVIAALIATSKVMPPFLRGERPLRGTHHHSPRNSPRCNGHFAVWVETPQVGNGSTARKLKESVRSSAQGTSSVHPSTGRADLLHFTEVMITTGMKPRPLFVPTTPGAPSSVWSSSCPSSALPPYAKVINSL